MYEESHITVVRRIYEELFNQMKLDLAEEFYLADVIAHDPYLPEGSCGTDLLKDLCCGYKQAFPDLHYQIDDILAVGDKVTVRWKATGTHEGALYLGEGECLPPSGNHVSVDGISIIRFEGGKVAEVWQIVDMLGAFQQIGAVTINSSKG